MANQLCFRCFKVKGDFEVCPYCGYVENTKAKQVYQLEPGTILKKRYIMGTSLGFGGFGITYKAFDTALGIVVAIKEFYPAGLVNRGDGETKVGIFSGEKEGEFKRQLVRFLEEARNMAHFSKEQDIMNVYDFFEENQTAYMIMEYVDAPLLKDRLHEGGFSVEEASVYMLAILKALSKVHKHGIIHKDISPDNIFLTGPDSIKLFDFGAAKFQGTESGRTEAAVVKAGYVPPEQYSSNSQQGEFTDIYAAGAVFYEMVTGEKPIDSLDRVAKAELKRPREYGTGVDDQLERIILKAMALDPRLRFQTADQFINAIAEHKTVDLPEESIRRQRRRKRILTAGMAAVAVVAGGILVISQTVFSARGKIDPARLAGEELSIWIPVEGEAAGDQMEQTLLESVAQEYPQLTVNVETIASSDYPGRLKQAADQDNLPDVFCVDSVSEADCIEPADCCAELSSLVHTIDLSEYLYLERFSGKDEIYSLPTAVQVGIAYINEEKTKELPESTDIIALGQKEESMAYADEEDVFDRFQDEKGQVSWIVGDMSDLDHVEAVTVDAVPSTDFTAVPVLSGEKLTGNLKGWYGVKKSGNKNREKAGMLLLSMLLSDGMQSEAYMGNEEGLPLNRTVLDIYKENKLTTYLAFLRDYDLDDMQLYEGEICRTIREELGN